MQNEKIIIDIKSCRKQLEAGMFNIKSIEALLEQVEIILTPSDFRPMSANTKRIERIKREASEKFKAKMFRKMVMG